MKTLTAQAISAEPAGAGYAALTADQVSVNPHRQPAPATQQEGERVYAFRRKGLADFCTCDEARYEELSNKPHLFETRIFYTAPQPSPTAPAAPAAGAVAGPDDYTPLLDDEGRMMVGTSHHYTAENIRALVAEYKALEAGGPDTWELHYNTDHRARAGVLWRVISALADEVPFAAAAQAAESVPAVVLDMAVMQLAESVGLIGPASRVHDLHAAIQRFHDLICVNATIKAAVMAADAISGATAPAQDYPPLPMQFACSGVFPVYSADQMRAYVDSDRAARAPADSVTAPAAYSGNLEQELAMLIRRIVSSARRNCEDGSNVLKLANEAWAYLVRKGLNGSPLRDAGIESDPTPPAQAADSVLEDAARWLAIESMIEDVSGGDGVMVITMTRNAKPEPFLKRFLALKLDALDAARKQGGA